MRCGARAEPKPGPGEVLVAVRASGLCHTDVEILRGNYRASAFPVTPGHEFAGEVVEVGPGVVGGASGDRMVVDPNIACGRCRACLRGWAHLCEKLGAYGVTVDGGFAVLSVVRADALHGIGDLSFAIAALAEPMGCALNGVEAGRGAQAQNAPIIGAGPVGVLLALALRAQGVADITLSDIDPARLALADGLGFGAAPAGGAAVAALRRGVDLAVDATSVPAVAATLPDYVADGGVGLFFGVAPADARIAVAPFELFRRQIALVGSHSLNRNIPQALRAIRACGDDVARLVSHQLPLEDVAAVLIEGAPRGAMKVKARFA